MCPNLCRFSYFAMIFNLVIGEHVDFVFIGVCHQLKGSNWNLHLKQQSQARMHLEWTWLFHTRADTCAREKRLDTPLTAQPILKLYQVCWHSQKVYDGTVFKQRLSWLHRIWGTIFHFQYLSSYILILREWMYAVVVSTTLPYNMQCNLRGKNARHFTTRIITS